MNWRDFQAAAPDLAAQGRARFERTKVALLGTLRADGGPRISPVEPYLVGGELLFGVMRSAKAADLDRDDRCTVHSSVTDPNGSEGEFKLFGRAVPVADPELRSADPKAWWVSYPPQSAAVYALDIESAAFVAWNFESMTYDVLTWSPARGVVRRSSGYP